MPRLWVLLLQHVQRRVLQCSFRERERVRWCVVPSPYFLVGFSLVTDMFGWMINAFCLGEEVFIIHSYIPVRLLDDPYGSRS